MTEKGYIPLTTTTTTTMTPLEQARYRFGGFKYQIQGGSTTGPGWIVPKEEGLYPFPAEDEEN